MIIYSTVRSSRRTLFTITLVTDNSTKLDTTKPILQFESHSLAIIAGNDSDGKTTNQTEEDDEAGDVAEHPPEGDL